MTDRDQLLGEGDLVLGMIVTTPGMGGHRRCKLGERRTNPIYEWRVVGWYPSNHWGGGVAVKLQPAEGEPYARPRTLAINWLRFKSPAEPPEQEEENG